MILKLDNQEITMKKFTEDTENLAPNDFKWDKCNYLASTKTVLKLHKTMNQLEERVSVEKVVTQRNDCTPFMYIVGLRVHEMSLVIAGTLCDVSGSQCAPKNQSIL